MLKSVLKFTTVLTASIILTGCTVKPEKVKLDGVSTTAVYKQTVKLKNCPENSLEDKINVTLVNNGMNHPYVNYKKPENYQATIKMCKVGNEQVELIVSEALELNGIKYYNGFEIGQFEKLAAFGIGRGVRSIVSFKKCGVIIQPSSKNSLHEGKGNRIVKNKDFTLSEYDKRGFERAVSICENENGLIDFGIELNLNIIED